VVCPGVTGYVGEWGADRVVDMGEGNVIEDYEAVREAIARWMGWEYGIAIASRGTSSITVNGWYHPDTAWDEADYQAGVYLTSATIHLPDPLNNPADAWLLTTKIAEFGYEVEFSGCDVSEIECRIGDGDKDFWFYSTVSHAEALIIGWDSVFNSSNEIEKQTNEE
jgi:hypothetical protein